jgi:WD40 repeat protein
VRLWKGQTGPVWGAGFSPEDGRVVTVSDDSTARIWDVTWGYAARACPHREASDS